ncbi:hypothetical protein BG53_06330 [Paenibacillus darwinianus]|uniref:Urease accessory protein UreD n=1 Tax=Paenibacillus darwinianus TaxID=1380763 RepID=A0A9W5RZI4_9BACL|nr:urease accessory protein UreD [Paenibacillus darwinianus]EXX86300.1 hypothetical protein CH50_07400 [Paenibacillus darwinianus]EXX86391.1 hypothetical protein BG53_06330 [Paenibacillus darwinianus]EXX91000.1 hypothetical protein BG52_11645 [Paenibacillus darwinianus]
MRGKLDLVIAVNRRDRSFISRMHYLFPLKILRPFYLDEIGTAFVYVLDTAGGMLAGDSLAYNIRVDDGARLYLTNASTAKCYTMPNGDARVAQHFSIGSRASLEFFPEESMLFRDTSLETVTRIDAQRDSGFAFCEMYAGGRKHAGEIFEFRRLENRFEIRIDGKLAIWENYRLEGGMLRPGRPGYLEHYTHWGNLYMYASHESGVALKAVQECLAEFERDGFRAGCSLHPSGVITVKALSSEYEAVKNGFERIWSRLRPLMLKEELPYIRK